MQMMLACGAFVMSEKITPNSHLRPGVEYIEVSNEQDLYDKVRFYLNDDKAREKIAENARKRILGMFDSKKRFLELIDGIIQGKYRRFSVASSGITFINIIEKMNRFLRRLK